MFAATDPIGVPSVPRVEWHRGLSYGDLVNVISCSRDEKDVFKAFDGDILVYDSITGVLHEVIFGGIAHCVWNPGYDGDDPGWDSAWNRENKICWTGNTYVVDSGNDFDSGQGTSCYVQIHEGSPGDGKLYDVAIFHDPDRVIQRKWSAP